MSHKKKIEADYNNGIISISKLQEQRDFYNKLSKDEKIKIDKKYGTEIDETNNSEINLKDQVEKIESTSTAHFYFLSILVGLSYSFIKMSIESSGDFSSFYSPFIYFFTQLTVVCILSIIFSGIVSIFNKKSKFIKIFFWTILIISFLLIFGLMSNPLK